MGGGSHEVEAASRRKANFFWASSGEIPVQRGGREAKDFGLDVFLVDIRMEPPPISDAVEDDVVGFGVDFGGVGVEEVEVFVHGGGEGVVLGDVAAPPRSGGVEVEAGEFDDPEEVPFPFRDEVEVASDFLAEFA